MRPFAIPLIALSLFFFAVPVRADFLSDADKARLQAELDSINGEIAQWQSVIDATKVKKASLQGDVTSLNALIAKATAEIKARNITITELNGEIADKQQNISALEDQLDRGKTSLASTLRIQNEADGRSLAELVLSSDTFSSFYGDLDALAVVRRSLGDLFKELEDAKTKMESEKAALTDKQNQEVDARYEVQTTQQQISADKAQKAQLLKVTADSEAAYETVLAQRERQAEQITNALFPPARCLRHLFR